MESVDFYASERQYADHLLPLWWALDPAERGRFYCTRLLADRLAQFHVEPLVAKPTMGAGLIAVAAHSDYVVTTSRPVVYVEHGAGQSYGGDPRAATYPGYSGGARRDRARLFIVPNQAAADRNAALYAAPNAVVGSPKLDPWHCNIGRRNPTANVAPVVALSFHWECRVAPEARTALPHYAEQLPALLDTLRAWGYQVLGHGHPRAWPHAVKLWAALGVEAVPEFSDVLDRADVYVCDNSSTIYEFASTDRPVVLLNAPWYRRDVDHGLRFWSEAQVGEQVDDPDNLPWAIWSAVMEHPNSIGAAMRRASVGRVYAHADGHAAERAVAAIRALAAI